MATLKDIANELNVSVALVSKVLNNSKSTTGASAKTAEAIRQTAARLGYTRNRTALSLRTGRHQTIAVMLHRIGAPGSNLTEMLLRGIADEANKFSQRLELAFFRTDESFRKAVAMARDSMIDALLIGGVAHPSIAEDLLEIKRSGMPVISACSSQIHEQIPNIKASSEAVSLAAMNHLLSCGCTRITHINVWSERYEGYLHALEQADIKFDPELVYTPEPRNYVEFNDGEFAVNHWLEKGVEFDGLFAPCDLHGIAAVRALLKAGKRVPQDVKIIGVDNSPIAEFGVVSLSSVSGDDERCGRLAIRLLMQMLDKKQPELVEVQPVLHARESTS